MNKVRTIRNEDVNKILVGVPEGHKHLRISMKLKNGLVLIFQEATIANILRVYTTVKTHPSIRAQELEMKTLTADLRKEGYAVHQLLETPRKNDEVERELKELIERGELSI
jgi:cell division septal protein FtsQ